MLKTITISMITMLFSSIASFSIASPDVWMPDHGYALFLRNNTNETFKITLQERYAAGGGCVRTEGDYTYPQGVTPYVIPPGEVVEVLNVNDPDCRTGETKWLFTLEDNNENTVDQYDLQLCGNGALAIDALGWNNAYKSESLTFGTSTIDVALFGRDSLHASGAYITLGEDFFGTIGPTADSDNGDKITVVSYNTYLGTPSKPDKCTRAFEMIEVLSTLDTDVLVLNEMNTWDNDCYDAFQLASYLWEGQPTATLIIDTDYAGGDDGMGSSPQGSGVFPYISQFVSGVPENNSDGYENESGGTVILSKYPLQMMINQTFTSLGSSAEKGYIAVKITKTDQDYYIIATHTQAGQTTDTIDIKKSQLAQIGAYLDTNPFDPDARVIIAGDLNTPGYEYYSDNSCWDAYFPYLLDASIPVQSNILYDKSVDESRNFYNNQATHIDWILYATNNEYRSFSEPPSEANYYNFPVRKTDFKWAELSDHYATTATFTYGQICPEPPPCEESARVVVIPLLKKCP